MVDTLMGTGRAFVLQIYAGTFERQSLRVSASGEVLEWCKRVMQGWLDRRLGGAVTRSRLV